MREGLLETMARIVELAGSAEHAAHLVDMRERFEAATGAYVPEDPWFEERSRAFWCDAVTRGRFGRQVAGRLTEGERAWLDPLERAHRGHFRVEGKVLHDVLSGAKLELTVADEASRAELDLASEQLVDARVVGLDAPVVVGLLPGAIFHPQAATVAIEPLLASARALSLSTHETLDALLRMERSLRALSRVKVAYAYRAEALAPLTPAAPVRRPSKRPT